MNGSANQAELQLTKRALPELAGDDVLVANRAVALNPVDGKVLDSASVGAMALSGHTGHIPDVDGAGEVVAGRFEAKVAEGARVVHHQDVTQDGSLAT